MKRVFLQGASVLAVALWLGSFGAPLARGASIQGITPGKSTRAEMQERFGEPAEGKGSAVEKFEAKRFGFTKLILFYDDKNVVNKAQLFLANELTSEQAALLFDFEANAKPRVEKGIEGDQTASAEHYDAHGVHFYIRNGAVREIWLVAPGAAPSAVPAPGPEPKTPPAVEPKTPPVVEPKTAPEPAIEPPPLKGALNAIRPGQAPAGKPPEPPSFHGLVVGRARREEARALLGPPRYITRPRPDALTHEHDGEEVGLQAIVVRYRPDSVIDQIELRFKEPVPRDEVVRVLGLDKPSQTVPADEVALETFAPAGIELTVQREGVSSLRLISVPPSEPGKVAVVPAPAPVPSMLPIPPQPVTPPAPAPQPPTPPAPAPQPQPPTPAPQPPAVAPTPAPPVPAGRRVVRVRRVWYEHGAQFNGQRGMMVYAEIAASGCQGQTITVTARLRRVEGQPIMAAQGTPPQFADAQGRLAAVATDTVQHDPVTWNPYRIFVPYSFINLPRGQNQQLILLVTAHCGGKANTMEAICTVVVP